MQNKTERRSILKGLLAAPLGFAFGKFMKKNKVDVDTWSEELIPAAEPDVRLSVQQVDEILRMMPPMDPTTRMAIKNKLFHADLMQGGYVNRHPEPMVILHNGAHMEGCELRNVRVHVAKDAKEFRYTKNYWREV